jgi:hypothetical protein
VERASGDASCPICSIASLTIGNGSIPLQLLQVLLLLCRILLWLWLCCRLTSRLHLPKLWLNIILWRLLRLLFCWLRHALLQLHWHWHLVPPLVRYRLQQPQQPPLHRPLLRLRLDDPLHLLLLRRCVLHAADMLKRDTSLPLLGPCYGDPALTP